MEKKINRRTFLKTAAAGAAATAVQISAPYVMSSDSEVLRIGYIPITDATPLLIAHARGYYQDEGLKVQRPARIRSWSTLSESFLTEKFNLVHLLLPIPIWMRYNKKAPVKVLAWDHTNGSAITVGADTGIEGFRDLGGKNIAVPYWYSMHNIILQIGLRSVGLEPVIQDQSQRLKPNQVNLLILPPPEMPLALNGKKIDGFIVAEPYNAISELKGKAKIMRFTGDIWKNHPCCVVAMKEKYGKENPVYTQKILNALVRAQAWCLKHPEETAKILSREGGNYLPLSEKILLRVFTKYDSETYGKGNAPWAIRHPDWHTGRIGFQPYPYPSATKFILENMKKTVMEGNKAFLDTLSVDFAISDLVDDKYVKNAVNNIGGPERFGVTDIGKPWQREETIAL